MSPVKPISKDQLITLQRAAEQHLHAGRAQAAIDELDRASEDLSAFPDLFRLGDRTSIQGNSTEAKLIFEQLEGRFGDNAGSQMFMESAKKKKIYQKPKKFMNVHWILSLTSQHC